MGKRYPLVHPNVKGFLHGGDYNPDQWLHMPEIIDEDFRLMKLAHCQTFSINIFAWSKLEPKEGNMILPGWMISWIAWQRRELTPFSPRQAEQDLLGSRKHIQKSYALKQTASATYTDFAIIIASPHRFIEKNEYTQSFAC